jgi:hypothetical protein
MIQASEAIVNQESGGDSKDMPTPRDTNAE